MRSIRLTFAWCFAAIALISAAVEVKLFPMFVGTPEESPIYAVAGVAFLLAVAVLFGIASWTIFTRKPSARIWGIVGSVMLVLLFGCPIFVFKRSYDFFKPLWILVAAGLAGIIIFACRDDAEPDRIPAANTPIPGDGTNVILNKLATWIGAAIVIGEIEFWERWARSYDLPDDRSLTFYLEFVIVIGLVVAIHEAGHAIAALAVDMKVISLAVGPFQGWISSDKWKFHFYPAGILSFMGVIQVVPTRTENFRRRKIIQIAAGPFASIATGLIAVAVLLTAPGRPWEAHWRILAHFADLSIAIGLTNLIPFAIKCGYSDGAKLYQLLSNGLWARYECVLGVYHATQYTSLRLRDYDIETIEQAAGTIARGVDELVMHLSAYSFYLDCERLAEADLALAKAERFCQQSPSDLPENWYCVFVFAVGFLRRDAVGARLWWERMKAAPSFQFADSLWASRCALLLSENRFDEAAEAWQKADSWSRQLPAAGASESMRHAVAQLGQALEESRAISLSPST
jgi:Zn-dependent protease